jgi:hypothetical protein
MSKRLVISESEKKEILSLYEVTTPPPSESVLVAKKNPFKYPEYESARREYSSDLKDGDMFYIAPNINEYHTEVFKKFTNEFLNSLKNKTIKSNDNIYTFLGTSMSESVNSYDYEIGFIYIKSNDGEPEFYDVYHNSDTSTGKELLYFKSRNGRIIISSPMLDDLFSKKYNEFKENHKVESLPDELFEIRKIQRLQTDF